MAEVATGLMTREGYRVKWYGTCDEAEGVESNVKTGT